MIELQRLREQKHWYASCHAPLLVQAHLSSQLKKRQQQKTTGVAGTRSTSLASPPPSRSYTPAPAEPAAPAEEGKRARDINDLYVPTVMTFQPLNSVWSYTDSAPTILTRIGSSRYPGLTSRTGMPSPNPNPSARGLRQNPHHHFQSVQAHRLPFRGLRLLL